LVGIEYPGSSRVIASFSDGTTAIGDFLVGCDGSRSQVRRILCPKTSTNYKLPIRLLGVSVPYPKEKSDKMQALDPYFFQATDPRSDVFMFGSVLKVPTAAEQAATGGDIPIDCQIIMSWPVRKGFMGKDEPTDIPEGNKEKLKLMRSFAENWAEPFKGIVQSIPDEAEAKVISLEDWPPVKGAWNNHDGRVSLIGDAAHAMTMCMCSLSSSSGITC
jgi:2-polyprenyl-6-methoxyphenol hydroxylase-like FAD-dependent oxidoreductase